MSEVTQEQLEKMMSNENAISKLPDWIVPLNNALTHWAINTPVRQAAFIAQVLHESGEFSRLNENLNYRADKLCVAWPAHFKDPVEAQQYDRNPEKIANRAYANRLGNGDESSGDGWKFHGRGLIQITGKFNYEAFSKALNIDAITHPEFLAESEGACLSAGWFWSSHRLNELADVITNNNEEEIMTKITKVINGGTNGLTERLNYWYKAQAALNVFGT